MEPDRLARTVVRRVTAGIDRPRRFLLLADLHLRPFAFRTYHRIGRAARWAARQGATHVLIAGDLLEDDREAEVVAHRLRLELGRLPTVYVSGNHEVERTSAFWPYRSNDRARIAAAMAAAGIERIDDGVVDVDGIPLVGIGWRGWRVGSGRAAAERVASVGRAGLVLAHSPDHVRGLPAGRVLLALCGHTHGGQVRLPLLGAPWTPVGVPLPRLAGAMSLGGVTTYVSRGIGATIPVRLGSVPEATLVEITSDPGGPPPDGAKLVVVRDRTVRAPVTR